MQGIAEAIIVGGLVALAAAYLIRRFYRGLEAGSTRSAACGGCCGGCDIAASCSGADLDRSA
jgi:hypothetical protein